LSIIAELLENLKFNTEKMIDATKSGFMTATDLADYLVLKDVPFREAHGIVGRIVSYCIDRGKELHELSLEQLQSFCPLIKDDIFSFLTTEEMINRRASYGGTAAKRVAQAIAAATKWLDDKKKHLCD